MRKFFCIMIFVLLPIVAAGQIVALESGESYRIECAGFGKGGVAPGVAFDDPSVLLYLPETDKAAALLWTIEEDCNDANGQKAYTLRHNGTGLYATYDGLRNDNKRYVEMTEKTDGDASRWTFVDRGGTWSIENVKAPEHHWHVRSSYLVGTYAEDVPPGGNSRFNIYTADGRRVTQIIPPEPSFSNSIGVLKINGKPAAHDSETNTYLATLSADLCDASAVTLSVDYDSKRGSLTISGKDVAPGGQHQFGTPSNNHKYIMRFTTPEGTSFSAYLAFTFMPIVELYGSFSASTSGGNIRVNDPDQEGEDELLCMRCHWRGNTSLNRAKKCYAVKLTDADGNSIDRKLLGLRNDNNWILDAAFVDPSRIRNRVSTDIWNDYHVAPYYGDQEPKARTATRGKMVEVFLNGSYDGIYCMTEKLDRKQLKLKKLENGTSDDKVLPNVKQHGLLYKAVEWHYTSYFGYQNGAFTGVLPPEPVNTSDAWGGWEIKYPDLGDGEPIDWRPLYNHVAFVATCTDESFCREAPERFDLPALRDYYLLQEMAMAFDNSAKNIYWFIYDAAESKKMSLAPWDFDGTWGRIWDGTKSYATPDKTLRDHSGSLGSANKIFSYLMRLNVDGWNQQLAERYAELRRSGIFDPDNLYARFASYTHLLTASGATRREIIRWDGNSGFFLDWEAEMDYIRGWIDTHIAVLDAFYHYDPIVGICSPSAAAPTPAVIDVYSPDGRCVKRINAESGREADALLHTLPAGVYIIGGRKVKIN